MINVLVVGKGSEFSSLEVKGHANSAPMGHDLVCAAVSAVITGGFNSLENKKDFSFKLNDGDAFLKSENPVSKHDEVVVETIITSLMTIAETNHEFIKIKFM
ncbi:MAG: ribosomal-processing cysteine protease Prp [Erysipelotrichaceae bacterium]|nr:ribosomal-processing cysteine protease Prp [Erysipelotrichaceae bacterium]